MSAHDNKDRKDIILESAKKDIDDYIDCVDKEALYKNYKLVLEATLLHKMKANDLDELGGLRLVNIPYPKEISLKDLRGILNDDSILEHIVFTIDVEQTIVSLRNHLNLTDIGIEPILKKILLRTNGVKETLKIEKGEKDN
jgi:hypothetical protein